MDLWKADRFQLIWIQYFLSNKFLYVKFVKIVWSGVPQGSHFGPLFFFFFINDIFEFVNGAYNLLFADDDKLYKNLVNGKFWESLSGAERSN